MGEEPAGLLQCCRGGGDSGLGFGLRLAPLSWNKLALVLAEKLLQDLPGLQGLEKVRVLVDDFKVLQIKSQPSSPLPRFIPLPSSALGFLGFLCSFWLIPALWKGSAAGTQPSPLPSKPGLTVAVLTWGNSSGTMSSSAPSRGPTLPLPWSFQYSQCLPVCLGLRAGA